MLRDFGLDQLRGLFALDHPGVWWRHDVDHDLGCALRMAELEVEYGIRATYYLRPGGPDYGLAELTETAGRLVRLGHRIGTHVEFGLGRRAAMTDAFLVEACERQRLPGAEHRVSLHRPPESALWREIPGFVHTLGPEWKGRYVSDSRCRFRRSPEEALKMGGRLQINLHPCWWFLPAAQRLALRLEHEHRADDLQMASTG